MCRIDMRGVTQLLLALLSNWFCPKGHATRVRLAHCRGTDKQTAQQPFRVLPLDHFPNHSLPMHALSMPVPIL